LRSCFLNVVVLLLTIAGLSAQTPSTPSRPSGSPEAVIGPNSRIIPPPANYTFPEETFVYNAEWRIWSAGTVTLGISREGTQQRVSGTAESIGVVSMLYPVHDHFQSLFDPKTGCSLSLHKHTEEGLHKRDTLISYIYSRGKSVLDETNLKTNETKHVENDIPNCVTDVISGLMYLRTLPLVSGSSFTLPINDGGKTVNVNAKVEARETLKVPAGNYQTVRVSAEAGDNFKLKGKIWIWYTDDARHVPIQMRGKAFWGTIDFKLTRIDTKK
jgi:hypothetical protein